MNFDGMGRGRLAMRGATLNARGNLLRRGLKRLLDLRTLSSDRGQSMLEIALLTPLLLALLLGVIELGRYAYLAILVGNAAHAGVAYGAQGAYQAADANGITQAACQDFSGQDTCSLTVNKSYVCTCDSGGTISAGSCTATCATGQQISSLQVSASGSFNALFRYPGIPGTFAVTSTATMRISP